MVNKLDAIQNARLSKRKREARWLRTNQGVSMPKFAFMVMRSDGSSAYEESDFALRSEALEHARLRVDMAAQVRVGLLASTGVNWLGRWSSSPGSASWEPRDG